MILEQQHKQKPKEDLREKKGATLSLSRNIYRLQNTDTFYVESERSNNIYYFVRYNPDVLEWCSCPDSSIRSEKCKHQFAIEYAIRLGTLKDIDKLPKEVSIFKNQQVRELEETVSYHSYRDDQYDF